MLSRNSVALLLLLCSSVQPQTTDSADTDTSNLRLSSSFPISSPVDWSTFSSSSSGSILSSSVSTPRRTNPPLATTPLFSMQTLPQTPPPTQEAEEPKKVPKKKAAYIFSQNIVRRYNIEISPTNWARMNRDVSAEEDVPCTFSIDFGSPEEQTLIYASCRYKGSIGSLRACIDPITKRPNGGCRKLSLKIDVDDYMPDDADKATKDKYGNPYGLDKFQFHGMPMDMSLLAERTAYGMFNEAGVVASRATHAKLYLNGNYHGIFVLVEDVDALFTKDRFGHDANKGKGALYKEILPKFTTPELYRKYHKDGDNEDEFMMEVAAMVQASDETQAGANYVLDRYFDVEALVSVIAINGILGQSDDWRLRHNFYWYVHETKLETDSDNDGKKDRVKKLVMIPWDYDRLNDMTVARAGLPPKTLPDQSPFFDAALVRSARYPVRVSAFGGSSVFSSPMSSFGQPTSTMSSFGQPTTTMSSFGQPTSTIFQPSSFVSQPSISSFSAFSSPTLSSFPSSFASFSSPIPTFSASSFALSSSFLPSSFVGRRQFERGDEEPEWFERFSPYDARCRPQPTNSFFQSPFEKLVAESLPPETEIPIQCDKLTRLMALVLKPRVGQRVRELVDDVASLQHLDKKWKTWSKQLEDAVSRDRDGPTLDVWTRSKLALGEHIVRNRDTALKTYN